MVSGNLTQLFWSAVAWHRFGISVTSSGRGNTKAVPGHRTPKELSQIPDCFQMADVDTHEVTQLLIDWSNGDRAALDALVPLVEQELRRLAHRYMNRERMDHTLQTTALVNEAYLRLVNRKNVHWQNRAHFFGIAAQLMRTILVDHARAHASVKRGGGGGKLQLDEALVVSEQKVAEVIALDDALNQLALMDPQQSRIVELRFFGGLTVEETAEVLHLSPATIKREWSTAKAWLYQELVNRES